MKYMIMIHSPRDGYEQYMRWPREVLEANIAFMRGFVKELRDSGELVGTEGLGAPTQALAVRAGPDGRPVTDGVFPESKEFLAGYWIVDVDSQDRAAQIAGRLLEAPHDEGPQTMVVEIRQVLGGFQDMQ